MYRLFRDIDNLSEVEIDPYSPVFCDTETMVNEGFSSGGLYGKVRLFQLYQKDWEDAVIVDCKFIPLQTVLDIVQPHILVWHNAAYDLHTINLATEDVWLPKDIEDTLYLSRMMYYTKIKFGFYECLSYAKCSDDLIKSIDKKEEQKSNWSGPLTSRQLTYAAADVIYLEKLFNEVRIAKSSPIYRLDITNLKYAINYARTGMPINRETVKNYIKDFTIKLENVLEKLPINPRSSKQASTYLGTKSSAKEVLLDLIRDGNERAKNIDDARHFYKTLEYLHAYDRDRIKGFFQPCAALSGRFSCTGGDSYDHHNLQQIPNELHDVVEAPEGYHIIYKDYSGLELRMAVAYTGEPVMAELMKAGADMHTETAKTIFNLTEDPIHLQRTVAKTFNFGLIYGGGIKTIKDTLRLDANIDMPFQQVKELREKWFDMYYYFQEWHDIMKEQMNVFGYADVETALGRKVRVYKLTDALNLPIQGSSVEVQKTALGLLSSRYPEANLINTIHDSNLLLERIEEAEMWGERLNECMIEAWQYVTNDLADPDIPMPGGFDHGPVWTFH